MSDEKVYYKQLSLFRTALPTKTDEFSEKFQKGEGVISDPKIFLYFEDIFDKRKRWRVTQKSAKYFSENEAVWNFS